MFKKTEPPKQLIRLNSRPLLSDLQKFCDQVKTARDKSIAVCWNSPDGKCSYTLSITTQPGTSDPSWRMSSQQGAVKKDLWFYISDDVSKIFSACMNSLGENVAEAMAQDARSGVASSMNASALSQMNAPPATGLGSSFSSGMPAGMSSGSSSGYSSGMSPGVSSGMSPGMSSGMSSSYSSGLSSAPDHSGPGAQQPQQRAANPLPIASPGETLTGNLAVLHITNLLQSISMGKMTGRLHIEPDSGPVEVFFEGGSPVHAYSRTSNGEEAFLEVVALNNGSFIFEPNLKTDTRSISKTLDSMILKGIQILDCMSLIEGAGVTINSIVHRSQQGLSEQEFERRISEGAPIDMALQKKFYIAIDGQSSIKILVDNFKLPRSEWVPIVSNLVKVGLATFTSVSPAMKKRLDIAPKRIDLVVAEQFLHTMKKSDTGALTFQAFNYFLQQEFLRYKRSETPFSVVVIDIRCQKPGGQPQKGFLNPAVVQKIVQTMSLHKRELDLVTHYEGQSLAVLFPHTHAPEAGAVVKRMIEAVNESNFTMGMEKLIVTLVAGVASMPGDVVTTPELLAVAEMARDAANNVPSGIQLFAEM